MQPTMPNPVADTRRPRGASRDIKLEAIRDGLEFGEFIKTENAKYRKIAKQSGVRME